MWSQIWFCDCVRSLGNLKFKKDGQSFILLQSTRQMPNVVLIGDSCGAQGCDRQTHRQTTLRWHICSDGPHLASAAMSCGLTITVSRCIGNETVTKVIINNTTETAISIFVISNHNSFRVLFDKIASVYIIWKIYIYILALEMASPWN